MRPSRRKTALRVGGWEALAVVAVLALVFAGCSSNNNVAKPGPLDCSQCHGQIQTLVSGTHHADSQDDVASELAEERAGETPHEVLTGNDPEDCIACHGPRAVTADGGMTEEQALAYFFTTEGGKFTANTVSAHPDEWTHVMCLSCHETDNDHPSTVPVLALFDARTAQYVPMAGVSGLCGQCHGSLRFAGTDHLTHDAWLTSKHSETQQDVADELAEERAGETPHEVLYGDDPENCIACHGPTAVLANGGMSEEAALGYFFGAEGGTFHAGTSPAHADQWPDVSCAACHNPHSPEGPSYFNSSTKQYEPLTDATQLCGRCHGSLRFPGTDHLSYDVRTGTGGIGVADQITMPGATCTDCHMYASDEDESNSSMYHGHSFAITVQENGGSTTSCTRCHPSRITAVAEQVIADYQSEFETLHTTTAANVEAAAAALEGSTDQALLDKLEEAQHNLEFAEGDESGGFHNHKYLMALLNDANARAQEILGAL